MDAFSLLVARHQRVLFNTALRMVGNYEDARDITQTAFLRAYQKLDQYDARYKFFSWIYRIMLNESLNLLGRRRRLEPLDPGLCAHTGDPGRAIEAREEGLRVQAALMQLPHEQREAVVLRHFAELSYAEISEALGIPEKTVKSRLYSARQRLCDLLRAGGEES